MDWRGPVKHMLQAPQSSVLFIIIFILRLRASHDLEPLVDGVVDLRLLREQREEGLARVDASQRVELDLVQLVLSR